MQSQAGSYDFPFPCDKWNLIDKKSQTAKNKMTKFDLSLNDPCRPPWESMPRRRVQERATPLSSTVHGMCDLLLESERGFPLQMRTKEGLRFEGVKNGDGIFKLNLRGSQLFTVSPVSFGLGLLYPLHYPVLDAFVITRIKHWENSCAESKLHIM